MKAPIKGIIANVPSVNATLKATLAACAADVASCKSSSFRSRVVEGEVLIQMFDVLATIRLPICFQSIVDKPL
jgi:hypothetical protein